MNRKPASRPPLPLWLSAAITLLTAVFVAMGIVPLLHAATRVLPTHEVKVKIVDREQIESINANRHLGLWQLNYRVTVEFEDGSRRKLACRKELYDEARGVGRQLGETRLTLSALAGRPLALSVSTKSLVKVPLLGIEGKTGTTLHPLTMPGPGILVTALFCWGIVGWLVWRLPRLPGFHWGVFSAGMALAVSAAFFWWAKSV